MKFFVKNKYLFLIFVSLLLIPTLFWNQHLYFAGGDDTLLYYKFPYEMINNYVFNIISDNILSGLGVYGQQIFLFPFFSMIYFIKIIFPQLNVQLFFYGLNLSFGFLSFYLLLGIWIKNEKPHGQWIKILSSLFYILSIFSFYTLWASQLLAMYLISIFPLTIFLFIHGIQTGELFYILLDALILSFFSILLVSAPWILGLVIAIIPLLIFVFIKYRRRFVIFSSILAILFILINLYWLVHLFYSFQTAEKGSRDILTVVNTSEFRKNNEDLIKAVSSYNQVGYPLFNLFHKNIQLAYGWSTYGIYKNWHLKLLPFNFIFLIIIFYAGSIIRKVRKPLRDLFIVSASSWLVALYLFTVNFGNWGIKLFLWLNNAIPGFTMLRNMQDKLGLAMAFTYAFVLGISLKICFDNLRSKVVKVFLSYFLILLVLVNAKPFIFGDYYKNPMWSTKHTYNTISDFNSDFYSLIKYIKKMSEAASRFVWLPLNRANYVQIQDKYLPNHYYSGVSPLQFLTGKNDYNGYLSFNPEISGKIFNYLVNKRYNEIGLIFQKMNIKYIILNNNLSNDLKQSYLYGGDLTNAQDSKFYQIILGKKIRDFGARYSLYEINEKFENQKIYITDALAHFPSNFSQIRYKKVTSYKYDIEVKKLKNKEYLVFLDPYHKFWELRFKKDNKLLTKGSHYLSFNYANGWLLNSSYIRENFSRDYYKINSDGSIDLNLVLYFRPQDFFYPATYISILSFITVVGFLLFYSTRKNEKAKI